MTNRLLSSVLPRIKMSMPTELFPSNWSYGSSFIRSTKDSPSTVTATVAWFPLTSISSNRITFAPQWIHSLKRVNAAGRPGNTSRDGKWCFETSRLHHKLHAHHVMYDVDVCKIQKMMFDVFAKCYIISHPWIKVENGLDTRHLWIEILCRQWTADARSAGEVLLLLWWVTKQVSFL